jgi:endonuclease-3
LKADLRAVIADLARLYPAPAILTDPLQQILWDNIGYLIDDERRAALFEEFTTRVGLTPSRIAGADPETLLDIARRGGMRPETRVQRWRDIADIVLTRAGGDLAATLAALSLAKARALLKAFPAIGDPGADRILLFAGLAPRPSLESNGVRALARLGFFIERRDYAASWRAAVDVLVRQGDADRDWLISAYLVLRAHGQALCKRAAPRCVGCPLDEDCAHAVVKAL